LNLVTPGRPAVSLDPGEKFEAGTGADLLDELAKHNRLGAVPAAIGVQPTLLRPVWKGQVAANTQKQKFVAVALVLAERLHERVLTPLQSLARLRKLFFRRRGVPFFGADHLCQAGQRLAVQRDGTDDMPRLTFFAQSAPQLGGSLVDSAAVDRFAGEFRTEKKGNWMYAERLGGFCLLIKREVLDKIGNALDEWTDLSLFDTDILSSKAKQAGYSMAVCRDLYIHHFGTRTFAHAANPSP
jgi:hypothetical protein